MTCATRQLRRKLHQCIECGKPAGVHARCPDHLATRRAYHWGRNQRLRKAAQQEETP